LFTTGRLALPSSGPFSDTGSTSLGKLQTQLEVRANVYESSKLFSVEVSERLRWVALWVTVAVVVGRRGKKRKKEGGKLGWDGKHFFPLPPCPSNFRLIRVFKGLTQTPEAAQHFCLRTNSRSTDYFFLSVDRRRLDKGRSGGRCFGWEGNEEQGEKTGKDKPCKHGRKAAIAGTSLEECSPWAHITE